MSLIVIGLILAVALLSMPLHGFHIEDGQGSGRSAGINGSNRLLTQAIITTEHHHVNEEHGNCWSVPIASITPTGINDYFFYFKNTSSDANYIIPKIRLIDAASEQIELHSITGTVTGGTDVTPINRNLGSANTITGTIQTGVDLNSGITMTNNGVLAYMRVLANTQYVLRIESHFVISPSTAVALLAVTGTTAITGIVTIYKELL